MEFILQMQAKTAAAHEQHAESLKAHAAWLKEHDAAVKEHEAAIRRVADLLNRLAETELLLAADVRSLHGAQAADRETSRGWARDAEARQCAGDERQSAGDERQRAADERARAMDERLNALITVVDGLARRNGGRQPGGAPPA
ncbi:MAG: hypothetical protein ACRD1M_16850 [Terriglobales bacterium]